MENKAKKGLLLAVVIVLIILGAASSVLGFFNVAAASPVWFGLSIVTLLVYAVMIYYLIEDYKRPHGNLFRYCVSGYSWLFLIFCLLMAQDFSVAPLSVILFAASAILASYVAGRLNKLKSVTTVMSIVSALMLIDIIYTVADQQYTGLANDFGALFIDIQWFAIMATYLFRFKAHSEAGLKK